MVDSSAFLSRNLFPSNLVMACFEQVRLFLSSFVIYAFHKTARCFLFFTFLLPLPQYKTVYPKNATAQSSNLTAATASSESDRSLTGRPHQA